MRVEEKILAQIKKYEKIVIHRHMRPDPDAIGSQLGLKEIIRENFPEKEVVAVGSSMEGLEFLGKMDEVSDRFYVGSLVIVTDTANAPRISDARFDSGDVLIKMDHHPNDEPYGDLLLVDTTKSSASELIVSFANTLHLKLNDAAARLLYAGIVGDTGRFLYPATTSETMQVAAQLLTYRFDAGKLNREMEKISMNVAKLSGYVYQNIQVDENGAARVVLTQEIMQQFGVEDAQTSFVVSLPGTVDVLVAWGIFVHQEKGEYPYRVRLRSKGPAINEIAKRHNGGGHPLASGANARSIEECEEIYRELQETVKSWVATNQE